MTADPAVLLDIQDLRVRLRLEGREAYAVDGVDLRLGSGRALGVVGESGCGKSLTALAIMRLLPRPVLGVAGGRVLLEGTDLLALDREAMRRVRGGRVAMVFQEPMTALNPVFSCGEQIAEVLREHGGLGRRAANERAVELLDEVGIDRPGVRARQIPSELSGGMRQRVMIAIAIAGDPSLLLADEPTTALDVTVQGQILDLLDELRSRRGMGLLLISHDLALVSSRTDDVAVMYAGKVVEKAPAAEIFAKALHPYTLGLVACRPALGRRGGVLPSIGGQVPDVFDRPGGCAFHPRCPFATDRCRIEDPPPRDVSPGHEVRCHEIEAVRAAGRWPDGR